jgi:hypothetical protein
VREPARKAAAQSELAKPVGLVHEQHETTVEAVRHVIISAVAEVRSVAQTEQDKHRNHAADSPDGQFAGVRDRRVLRGALRMLSAVSTEAAWVQPKMSAPQHPLRLSEDCIEHCRKGRSGSSATRDTHPRWPTACPRVVKVLVSKR